MNSTRLIRTTSDLKPLAFIKPNWKHLFGIWNKSHRNIKEDQLEKRTSFIRTGNVYCMSCNQMLLSSFYFNFSCDNDMPYRFSIFNAYFWKNQILNDKLW